MGKEKFKYTDLIKIPAIGIIGFYLTWLLIGLWNFSALPSFDMIDWLINPGISITGIFLRYGLCFSAFYFIVYYLIRKEGKGHVELKHVIGCLISTILVFVVFDIVLAPYGLVADWVSYMLPIVGITLFGAIVSLLEKIM